METAIYMLVGLLLAELLYASIMAVSLRFAAKWVARTNVTFGRAFSTALAAGITSAALSICVCGVLCFCIYRFLGSVYLCHAVVLLTTPLPLCIASWQVASYLDITFRRACLVWITTSALSGVGILR